MFERLNSEQEAALKELLKLESAGGLPHRLEASDGLNTAQKLAFVDVYKELSYLGFIPPKSLSFDMQCSVTVLSLTSKAHTYFEEMKANQKEKRGNRFHDYRVAAFSFTGGAVFGYLIANLAKFL